MADVGFAHINASPRTPAPSACAESSAGRRPGLLKGRQTAAGAWPGHREFSSKVQRLLFDFSRSRAWETAESNRCACSDELTRGLPISVLSCELDVQNRTDAMDHTRDWRILAHMDSDDAGTWRLKVEAALQEMMVSGLISESRAGGLNSTLRVCDVCGQSFDTLDQGDVFHHGAELHPPRSAPHLVTEP